MDTVEQVLAAGARALRNRSDTPELDSGLLLAQVLGSTRSSLLAHGDRHLAPTEREAFAALLGRRATGEPVAYLTGRRAFWTLELEVTPEVLIPRPESELLVELALARLAGRRAPRVLDLGTGSGALAIALAVERPDSVVIAVEDSAVAIAVARRNAAAAGAANVEFRHGHWYGPVPDRRFDAILANPPYLAETDAHLEALRFEPRAALVAGPTGLEAIGDILFGAAEHLAPGGFVVVEHGADQGEAVRGLCGGAGLREATTQRDLAGHERATAALAPAPAAAAR